MYCLRILYTPQEEKNEQWIKSLESAFREYQDLDVSSKSCEHASMNDFQAADIIIIGQLQENGLVNDFCDNFKEIIRALKGVNLAGRVAGFLCYKKNSSPLLFEEALKDTDIRYFQEKLVLKEGKNDKSTLTHWATKLYSDFKSHLHT